MIVSHKEQRAVEVVDDVLCDRCGKSCKGNVGNVNGLHFDVAGAYDSTHFPDCILGYVPHVDVCERCASEWFASFVRNPLEPECSESDAAER